MELQHPSYPAPIDFTNPKAAQMQQLLDLYHRTHDAAYLWQCTELSDQITAKRNDSPQHRENHQATKHLTAKLEQLIKDYKNNGD